jgi:hypothetical protein
MTRDGRSSRQGLQLIISCISPIMRPPLDSELLVTNDQLKGGWCDLCSNVLSGVLRGFDPSSVEKDLMAFYNFFVLESLLHFLRAYL